MLVTAVIFALDINNIIELLVNVTAVVFDTRQDIFTGRDIDFSLLANFFLNEVDGLNIIGVIHRQVHRAFIVDFEQNRTVLHSDSFWNLVQYVIRYVAGVYLNEWNMAVFRK